MRRIFTECSEGLIFNIYLTPGASRTCINGVVQEDINKIRVKISVHSKPVDNQANLDLIKFISDTFNIPKSYINIVSGYKSRSKKLCLRNFSINDVPSEVKSLLQREINRLAKTLF